jgi:AcrR family transcriptional regulator
MTETLRDQQRRVARERIFDAAAEEIVATGLMNMSIQAVADRAGVSHRTVYNHFENKDRLVEELWRHVEDEMFERGGIDLPSDLVQLPDAIRVNWLLFEQSGIKGLAMARVMAERAADGSGYGDSESSRARTTALHDALAGLRPDYDEAQLQAVTSLIRLHVSFHAWYRMTNEFGVDSETAGDLAAWAFRTMRDALTRGDGPFD